MAKQRPEPPPPIPAPAHLSPSSAAMWCAVVTRKDRWSAGRLAKLVLALEVRDRRLQARAVIARDGMTVTSERSGLTRAHPLLTHEAELGKQFATLWQRLGLDFDPHVDGCLVGLRPGELPPVTADAVSAMFNEPVAKPAND